MENYYFNKWIGFGFIFLAVFFVILIPLWILLEYTREELMPIFYFCVLFVVFLLILIVCYTIVICKKMKIKAESDKQTTAYTLKENWELFQYKLYREENEKRFEYEKQKQEKQFEYEKEKWLYDKNISTVEEIKSEAEKL